MRATPGQREDWRDAVKRGGFPAVALELESERERSIWFDGYIATCLERDLRDLHAVANGDLVSGTAACTLCAQPDQASHQDAQAVLERCRTLSALGRRRSRGRTSRELCADGPSRLASRIAGQQRRWRWSSLRRHVAYGAGKSARF
jgi:hypothetical protein